MPSSPEFRAVEPSSQNVETVAPQPQEMVVNQEYRMAQIVESLGYTPLKDNFGYPMLSQKGGSA